MRPITTAIIIPETLSKSKKREAAAAVRAAARQCRTPTAACLFLGRRNCTKRKEIIGNGAQIVNKINNFAIKLIS